MGAVYAQRGNSVSPAADCKSTDSPMLVGWGESQGQHNRHSTRIRALNRPGGCCGLCFAKEDRQPEKIVAIYDSAPLPFVLRAERGWLYRDYEMEQTEIGRLQPKLNSLCRTCRRCLSTRALALSCRVCAALNGNLCLPRCHNLL